MAGSDGAVSGAAQAAVAVISGDGVVIGWTEAAEALLGHQAETVVSRPAALLLPTARPGALLPPAVTAREPWSGVMELRHRDGHPLPVSMRALPMAGPGGRTDWFVSAAPLPEARTVPALDESVLTTLLNHAPIQLAIWDRDLRCMWLNDTAERDSGALAHQALGRRLTDSLPGFDTASVEAAMRQVLDDGVPVIDHEFRWIGTDQDGSRSTAASEPEERVFSSSYFRLDGVDGRPLGVCSLAMDISNSWARRRLAILNEAGTRIGTTLDVMNTAQELADVAVPLLADFVTVDLAESVQLGEEPQGRPGTSDGGTVFRRAGVASIHEGAPESVWARGEPIYVPPSSPFSKVLSDGQSHFEPVLDTTGTWFEADPARARATAKAGIHSLMLIGLKARGTVLGVAVFLRTDTLAPFSRDDLLLAEELVVRASLSLDNARRYTRERTAALTLQRHLLPRNLSGGRAVEVATRYLPADLHDGVGGDWFDVIPLSGARIALVIGDVVGHGINAAAMMGQLRTAVHTLADMDLPPAELLARLDELVVHLSDADSDPDTTNAPGISATCVYVVYDPISRQCVMARAGHPPPAIVTPDGGVTFPEIPAGAPIGLGLLEFESAEMVLPEGSVIALYTDGLIESRTSDIDSGMAQLARTVGDGGLPLDELCSQVVDTLAKKTPCQDDVALLLARTRSLGPEHVVSWELANDPAVVTEARALAVGQLKRWGLEALSTTMELIVSELVTNAIRYGGPGPVQLRLIRHTTLECQISDSETSSPRMRHARLTDEHGRGLHLVSELSRRWGTRFAPGGKIAWAELDIPPGADDPPGADIPPGADGPPAE
ncbi:SpoIIE family protein phosphatase [Streptomyces sp. NBC_00370]|uniref:SpoIIE family protein phosphatase n=1 Tax=Streptomyces sp. NBC_00370 TaxID=2975728 RepID=UPI002E25BB5B